MKNSAVNIILIYLLSIMLFACDKIEDPIIKAGDYRSDLYGDPPSFSNVQTPIQNVLLEDFTGQDCGNCPIGHSIAKGLYESNPDRISLVAVHAGTLAAPFLPKYPDDWRTPEGQYYLLTQVGADEMPKARMNRNPDSHIAYSPGVWVARTNAALAETPPVHLQIAANYNSENKHLNVHVNHQWFQGLTGEYRLVILLNESHIIAPQLWYGNDPTYVPDYEHNHMMRTSVSGATGRVITNNPTLGSNATNSYTIDWNSNWLPENCEIVAFITEGENGRVLNSTHKKLIQ